MEFTSTSGAGGQGGFDKTTTPGSSGTNSAVSEALGWMLRNRRPGTSSPNAGVGQKFASGGAPVNHAPSYTPQLSSGVGMGSAPAAAPQRVTRMRALSPNQDPAFLNANIPSLIKMPNRQVEEYQLPDGSWSLDAVYGTLAGNEAAVQGINQARALNPTGYQPMDLSGGLSVLPPRPQGNS